MNLAAEITEKYIFHYVYRLENPDTGNFYIGVRSSDQLPEVDPYRGSYSTWEPECEREDLKKVILAQFPSREKANSWEKSMIEYHIDDPKCKNGYIPNVGFNTYGTIPAAHISDPTNFKAVPKEEFHNNRDSYIHSSQGKPGCWAGKKRPKWSKRMSGSGNPMYGLTGANSPTSKKVVHIESGEIYASQKLTAKALNIHPETVGRHCRGKYKNPKFKYYNPDSNE